jgi:soluble lytic murein transglycosylase-like protein
VKVQVLRKIVLAALCGAALPALAADVAVLRNGFEIRHERREAAGDKTRLYVSTAPGAGYVEVATAEIAAIQQEEYVAPVAVAAVAGESRAAGQALDVHALAGKAAGHHQIDQDFIEAVIRAESSGNPRARSRKGAQGLMQLMPATASKLGVKDAYDPEANVDAGTRHLRTLLEQYNGDAVKALAAYNAGPHRVAQYGGVPPYAETQAYVRKIIRDYNAKKRAQQRARAKTDGKKTIAVTPAAPAGQ